MVLENLFTSSPRIKSPDHWGGSPCAQSRLLAKPQFSIDHLCHNLVHDLQMEGADTRALDDGKGN